MSAKSVCDAISYSQGHEFLLVLEKAGLTRDITQEVIVSKGNRKAMAMMEAIASVDDRFDLVTSFDVVVPKNYNHATRLGTFREAHGKEFYYYDDAITDANYAKVTTKLIPERKLKVKIFQITTRVSSEDCLGFLRGQKAILLGAQGASLAYEQGKNQLPKGRWHVSFDEKNALWVDSVGYHRVPYVDAYSDGGFGFRLGYFGIDWDSDACLLCFCD